MVNDIVLQKIFVEILLTCIKDLFSERLESVSDLWKGTNPSLILRAMD